MKRASLQTIAYADFNKSNELNPPLNNRIIKTALTCFLIATFWLVSYSVFSQTNANNNETITGQWTFTNPNGAAITVDHSNKPSNGPSGGIRIIPSVRQWDSYFHVSHPN